MKVLTVLGARPQFIKAAPVSTAFVERGVDEVIIHTGQHYDDKMSDIFFRQMGIPAPKYNLAVGSGTHGMQTGRMLIGIEEILLSEKPDVVVVYGDTNSTVAGALAGCKLGIPIAHIEAGLRSFNKSMPEEHNRIVTDHVSDYLFCPSDAAVLQLRSEGIVSGVYNVGDTMYDAVLRFLPLAISTGSLLDKYGVRHKEFFLATIHRPYNTDDRQRMDLIFSAFSRLDRTVIFPLHPRTKSKIDQFGLDIPANVSIIEPLGYLEMLHFLYSARVVITDSGGVQKEACYVQTPCVTVRSETEWNETVEAGWNILAFDSADEIGVAVRTQENTSLAVMLAYGEGDSANKILNILIR